MSTPTKIAIALAVAGFIALSVCFVRAQRGPPRLPLSFEIKLGCIIGWLLWAGALCFIVAALLQSDDWPSA